MRTVAVPSWTQILHVFATIEVAGLECEVQKCDTKRAVLEVRSLQDEGKRWWTDVVRVGGVYWICGRWFGIEAMNAAKLTITLTPSDAPDEVEQQRLNRWIQPELPLDDQPDGSSDSDEWALPDEDDDEGDAWRDLGHGSQ